ncbi:MAG: alpha/beta fold hydrolase [Acidimicrobiales bacterium]
MARSSGTDPSPDRPVVLCHGAWGGSYGFRRVRPFLWGAGHEVFTPSLTGIGERSHLASPMIGLATHVQDLANAVLYEDLHDIVLVGFSYGGMVVTGALDQIGGRVAHLVYLDALVPADGQSAVNVMSGGTPTPAGTRAGADGAGGDRPVGSAALPPGPWTLNPVPRPLDTPEDTAWSDARRVGQPMRTLTEPVRLRRPLEEWPFTLTYIKATADPSEADDSAFWRTARHARASERWRYHEIPSTHMVPFSHAEPLAKILLALATEPVGVG